MTLWLTRHAHSLPIHDLPAGGRRFGHWRLHRAGYGTGRVDRSTFTLSSGGQMSGAGLYRVNARLRSLTVNTDVNLANLDLVSGTLNGTGALTVSNAMNWTGGTMSGARPDDHFCGSHLKPRQSEQGIPEHRTLENGGQRSGRVPGTSFIQQLHHQPARERCSMRRTRPPWFTSPATRPRFDNAGTFRKSVNAGAVTVGNGMNFNNYGAVENSDGCTSAGWRREFHRQLRCADQHEAGTVGRAFTSSAGSSITGAGNFTISARRQRWRGW